MTMNCTLADWQGYQRRQKDIDATILAALANEGKTQTELAMILRAECVGDASSDDPMALSYSTTGAILRAALNSLRMRKKIHDSWDEATDRQYPKPFRFFLNQ